VVLSALEASDRMVRGEFRPGGVEREWCDTEVLRRLRRRSLAALRREVEPVDEGALARFLPAWQGVGSRRRGLDGLVEVLGQVQGAALPFSALEADILPARLEEYRQADLDALCTAGEVVWAGAGAVGARDGKVRLAFRDQAPHLLAVAPSGDPFEPDPTHAALLDHLAQRGASFWPELVQAVASADLPYADAEVLAALWDLVWAGLVTNDSLAPLRALGAKGGRGGAAKASPARGRLNRLTRLGPPSAAGRWSLVAPLLEPAPTPTERSHALALQLLERHGVLTREAALAEGVEGGFAAVYPVLKALEDRGRVRRGYFVAGLGAAQFALPGAVDRLRAFRGSPGDAEGTVVTLSAVDPAQPYGAALRWPDTDGRPARVAGAHVVLADGEPVAWLDRTAHGVALFRAAADRPDWPLGLVALLDRGRHRSIEVRTVDGQPVREQPDALATLHAHGWVDTYKGVVRRR
jgi:ATP-dependent Lhr-like helicase